MDRLLSQHRCQCCNLRSVGGVTGDGVQTYYFCVQSHSRTVGMREECDAIKSHEEGLTNPDNECER